MYGQDCTLIGKLETSFTPVFKKKQLIALDFKLLVPRREPFCKEKLFERISCTYSGDKMNYLVEHYGPDSLLRVQGEFLFCGRYNDITKCKINEVRFNVYPEGHAIQAIILVPPKVVVHPDEKDDYVGFMNMYNAVFEED